MIEITPQDNRSSYCWSVFSAALFICYIALFFSLDALPFLDLPSHLVRAGVIAQLLFGQQFSDLFYVHLSLQPYLWGDVALGVLTLVMGPFLAARVWICFSFIALPLAIMSMADRLGLSQRKKVFLFLVMLYLASDWFFLAAFTNFHLGIALSFLALGLFINREGSVSNGRRNYRIATFLLLALVVYLLHFASFFFLSIMATCTCALRVIKKQLHLRTAILILAPLAALGLFHITQSEGSSDYFQIWVLRSLSQKAKAVGSMLVRFDLNIDIALASVFFLLIATPLCLGWREIRKNTQAYELLVTGLALGFVYLALPVAVATLSDVDGRALPFILATSSVLAALVGSERVIKLLIPVCATLATMNLIYLAPPLVEQNSFLRSYHHALRQVPSHKRLLPVTTRPEIGRIHTTTHAGDLYTLLSKGFTPYISNAYLGEPFTYFHYRDHYYAPLIFWYERRLAVEWNKVTGFYDYLIVTHPFDPGIFPQDSLERVFVNEAATVYKINTSKPN